VRQRLENRRASLTFDLADDSLRYVCSFACFADGRVAEIFLQNSKPGSASDCYVRDAAIAASLAL
jgi:hypothetical protein